MASADGAAELLLFVVPTALAQPEFDLILVHDFIGAKCLEGCYIFNLNDGNVAGETATIRIPRGGGRMPTTEIAPARLSWPRNVNSPGVITRTVHYYDIATG